MRPGQLAAYTATWVGALPNGIESQFMAGGDLALNTFSTLNLMVGVQYHHGGRIDPRDALLTWRGSVIRTDTLTWRLEPGVTIPTGGLGSELRFTPLSSASVDPYLSTDLIVGGQLLGVFTARARVPVYDGWDLRRQGAFLRGDARGAYRIGDVIPGAGVSAVRVLPSDPVGSVPDHAEFAALASIIWSIHDRWSVAAQTRIPLWVANEAPLVFSGGLALRGVLINPPSKDHH